MITITYDVIKNLSSKIDEYITYIKHLFGLYIGQLNQIKIRKIS